MKQNVSALKTITKISSVLAIMIAASACSHEQLKHEADVAAIEDTGASTAPTPDLADDGVTDPLAAPTPIPGESARADRPVKAHGKKHATKSHAKTRHAKSRQHKAVKTKVAAAGRVEAQLPPPPPGPNVTAVPEIVPAAPVAPPVDAALAAPVADFGAESSGHGLVISLAILALGGLAFLGQRLRKSRGSRRLVFN